MTTADLLAAIGRAKNRDEAAQAYRRGLHHQMAHRATAYYAGRPHSDGIDWRAANAAIIERWSHSGLNYVKCWAWKLERGA